MPDVPERVTNYRTRDGSIHGAILPDSFEGDATEFDISLCGLWLVLEKPAFHEQQAWPTKDEVTCLLCLGA